MTAGMLLGIDVGVACGRGKYAAVAVRIRKDSHFETQKLIRSGYTCRPGFLRAIHKKQETACQ